ncbi:hypothetical protein E3E12_07575 [Formicincola oecophyllae]|uniref:Uncharacterized protein n=1 Tax=Formicincola oecophyllae TaxID=2558361 RepID=A0A4Y6UC78_9PROT|nr:hypothetical protein [Formicincola oecophyllae]QDH14057.2 hypothetical protein E3E12_07575 [Formicincola oecophyllae]
MAWLAQSPQHWLAALAWPAQSASPNRPATHHTNNIKIDIHQQQGENMEKLARRVGDTLAVRLSSTPFLADGAD